MRLLFAIAIGLLCFTGTSQTADTVLQQYTAQRATEKEYQASVDYALYKGLEGNNVMESYSGVQAKHNAVFYQKIAETELVLGQDFMVKLNPEEKAIMIGYASQNLFDLQQLDNTKVLSFFKGRKLQDLQTQWKLTLTEANNISLQQFSRIELYLDKETLALQKQVFIYALATDFSIYNENKNEQDIDVARLEITYTNLADTVSIDKKVFDRTRYFSYVDNKIKVAPTYRGYELIYAN